MATIRNPKQAPRQWYNRRMDKVRVGDILAWQQDSDGKEWLLLEVQSLDTDRGWYVPRLLNVVTGEHTYAAFPIAPEKPQLVYVGK